MKITISQKGNLQKTYKFLNRTNRMDFRNVLEKYGEMGVEALKNNTPIDSGKTALSWYYEIGKKGNQLIITWKNSNIVNGVPIAIILQYGHGTRNGGYVRGIDYINPPLQYIFGQMAEEVWGEVISN